WPIFTPGTAPAGLPAPRPSPSGPFPPGNPRTRCRPTPASPAAGTPSASAGLRAIEARRLYHSLGPLTLPVARLEQDFPVSQPELGAPEDRQRDQAGADDKQDVIHR